MKNKITERKCKDCDVVFPYIPRKIRCGNCHQKYIDNAMITCKKNDDFTKGKQYELMKQAISKLENRDVSSISDFISNISLFILMIFSFLFGLIP